MRLRGPQPQAGEDRRTGNLRIGRVEPSIIGPESRNHWPTRRRRYPGKARRHFGVFRGTRYEAKEVGCDEGCQAAEAASS